MPHTKGKGPILVSAVYSDAETEQLAVDIADHLEAGHVVEEYDRVVKAGGLKFGVTVLIVRRRLESGRA